MAVLVASVHNDTGMIMILFIDFATIILLSLAIFLEAADRAPVMED